MTEDQSKRPVTVTRDELYRQVWETPMQRLAAQYGISGNGLAKICDRLKVPYPYRGYWAKKEAGKPVRQVQLPTAEPSTPRQVVIEPTPPRPSPLTMSAELQQQYETALGKASAITVPETLRHPHSVVAAWLAEHAREVADAKRNRNLWDRPPPKLTELDARRHRILDTVFKELEKYGFEVMYERYQGYWLQIDRERVDITLQEKIRQVRQPITPTEKKGPFYYGQQWRQLKVPTGALVFKIKTFLGAGVPIEWADEPEQPLERRISELIAVLILAGPILKERRRLAEEQERQRLEAERRRSEEAAQRKQERNRWLRFLELSQQWREAQIAGEFIAAIESLAPVCSEPIGNKNHEDWLNWARERLVTYDPLNNGPGDVWTNLTEVTAWDYQGN